MKDHQHIYIYDGPVMEFDRCINERWQGSTFAPSEKKARNNLSYQFKKKFNRTANSKISLPGKLYECTGYSENWERKSYGK